jgi:hypothetical protein
LACLINIAKLFIWDEAPMMYKFVFEAVDWTWYYTAKVLLGYFSQLKVKTISQKKSKSFKLAKHTLYQFLEYIDTTNTWL